MIPVIEKVLYLKSIDLFDKIPIEELSPIANIAEECLKPSGEEIIHEGDEGDCMYLLVDGRVKVHSGERFFVELGEGSCFGEMAILDTEPRSASITTISDCILLKISRDDFNELLLDKPQISRAILSVLTHRLREANKRAK